MIFKIAVRQATVIAIATLALVSFVAIRDGGDNTISWWAIPLAWALIYATLMLTSVYLVNREAKSALALRMATVLCGVALVESIGGLPSSPSVAISTLSALLLLIEIRRQAWAKGWWW
ncbi:MAG: hypothetical protein IH961_10435 [Chloroflexi bacterium]|nr:hypothetical protein [Chloroflexota bacterium]